MSAPSPEEITRLLRAVNDGDRSAVDRLLPLVYGQLRDLAHRQRLRWQGQETLNTTALVHEAYLKLVGSGGEPDWQDRAHFFRVAAKAMRYILLDYAKAKKRQKRGGDRDRVTLDEGLLLTDREADEVIALDAALIRLERVSPRNGQIVECRFFVGMTIEETAAALDLSPATVKRGWTSARAWLYDAIRQDLN